MLEMCWAHWYSMLWHSALDLVRSSAGDVVDQCSRFGGSVLKIWWLSAEDVVA